MEKIAIECLNEKDLKSVKDLDFGDFFAKLISIYLGVLIGILLVYQSIESSNTFYEIMVHLPIGGIIGVGIYLFYKYFFVTNVKWAIIEKNSVIVYRAKVQNKKYFEGYSDHYGGSPEEYHVIFENGDDYKVRFTDFYECETGDIVNLRKIVIFKKERFLRIAKK